jgi:hypothetical protein
MLPSIDLGFFDLSRERRATGTTEDRPPKYDSADDDDDESAETIRMLPIIDLWYS